MYLCDNISAENNHLYFANMSVPELAGKYGTPLYLLDENRIRQNCRKYYDAFKRCFPEGSEILYASKAASFKAIYKIIEEERLSVDVVSCGEIYTAKEAGVDMSKLYFQGNNKPDKDIQFAIDCGVGCFVADNREELISIDRFAGEKGICQNVLLRLTPGIEPHTYKANRTGQIDSKFGVAIETGQAKEMTDFALSLHNIKLIGFHCHIGSQVFDEDVFERSARIMLGYIKDVFDSFGYMAEFLDLGGGYGVRYTTDDPVLDIEEKISEVASAVNSECSKLNIPVPKILMEPGRSIVADAGMTVYTVGAIKSIPGYKNYVSIDGGMTDNPRYSLYGAKYTVLPANRMNESCEFRCTLAGRCCEDGDVIQPDVFLPSSTKRGDYIAVCTTGAYNYSMSSNYNRVPRPPVVMIKDSESFEVVKRESYEDLVRNDL